MRVLAVLWTACLVRFCSASWFSGKSKTDDKDAEIIAVEQPLKFHPPSDPKTVDLASLTDPRYKTVDVNIVGVPARVYMINGKEDIKKVKYNGKDVWKASRFSEGEDGYNTTPEEICTYCITFIKGTGTAMILVEIHDLSIYREIFRYKQKTGSNGNESGWERSPTEYGKEIATLKINTDPPTKFTLDISSLEEDDERFKLVREEKNATTLYYSSQPGNLIEKIVDGGRNIFTVPDNHICYLCELHSKGESKLLRIHAEHSYKISLFYYENTGSGWKIIHKDDFLKKLDEMNKSGKNLSDASKQVVAPKPAPTPVHDLKSKVDSTLFDVEEGQESGFKVLKLTPKEGVTSNKLLFDGKPVWQGRYAGDSCSLAFFYMGEKGLIGASYRFKRDGRLMEGYRQFSDGNWLQVRGDVFRKLIGKDDHVAKRGESSTKSAEHGATLDISSPDETKVDLKKGDESGLDYNIYSPKDGSKITSVVENGALVWTASGAGQKCLFVELHGKEELILAYSKVESDSGLDLKYFKKVGGRWNEVDKNTFNEVKTMDSKQGPPKSHSGATDEVHEETVETPTQKEKNSEKSVVPPGESSLKYPHLEENELRQPPLALPPGGSHANIHGPNAQRTPPPRSRGLRETATRDTLPGVKPTGTQTAVGKSTNTTAVNSKPSTRPVIEDIGEDLEEDLKHVKAYHENMQETTKTAPEVTSTTVPTEKPLEYKMDMALVTVGKSTEGTLSVVTYTAKPDANIPLLLHDNKLVWKGIDSMSNKDTLVKATVYLGSGGPLAANLTYKRVTESTTKEYCKLVKDRWTFVDKGALERTFDEVGELPGNANASAYRTKVDSTLFDVEVGKHNGIPVLNCTAKKGVKVPKLVYDSNVVWQADGNQSCSSATFYFGKSGIIGISFTYGSIEETLHDCFRVFSNDEWEGVNGDYYERVLYEAKNPETSVATASENTKAKSFIDTAKFTVVSDMDDTVPILRCTAGNGASKLTYGSDTIWPGKKDVTCLSAVLYLDGDKPTLAVLVTRDNNNNKQNKVYKYHDGKKWKNYKEKDHQSKFEELKKVIENRIRQHKILIASRTVDIAKFDANKGQSFDYTVDNVPVKMFIPKDNVTINRLVNGGTYLWSTENGKYTIIMLYLNKDNKPELVYIVRFIQGDSYSGFYKKDEDSKWTETEDFDYEFKKLRTAPTSSSQFTLDLSAHQDTTECRIFQAPLYGTNTRFYAPKSGHHASYIAHNGVSIWTAEEGERCTFVTSYLKDGQEHLFRMTTKNTNDKSSMKYFEKAGRGWKSVTKEDFDVKYDNLKSNAYKPSSIKDENTHKGHTQSPDRAPVKETLLDIGRPDPQSYKFFDYALDDVPTRLIVAVKEPPNKIVFGQETLWSDDTGRCNYCTVHMKDNRPVLVYISGRSFSLYLLKTDGGWKSIDNYSVEFSKLRVAVPSPSSFSLDISTNQDSPNCRIFDTLFNKVNTRFYVPKAGRYATSVSNGQAVLWKGGQEKAILVRLYPSDNPTLLHILSKDTNGAFKHNYLVKSANKWESINKDVHDRLLSEIKATAPGKNTDVGRLRQELIESQASLDKLVESMKFTDCDGPKDPSILDIVHYEESNAYTVSNCTLDGYPTTVFIPDKGSIKKVVYGTLTIWEGAENEECKYLMVHYVYSIPAFAYLIKGSDRDIDLYFANKGDKWEGIQVDYVRKLNGLHKDKPASGIYVIDINNTTSDEKCKVYSYTIDGLLTYSYYPYPEVTVNKIMEGGINVWNGGGERCLYITVTRVDKDGFMYFVTSKGSDIKYHIYHKGSNGNWTISYSNNYGSKWNEQIKNNTSTDDEEISDMKQERLKKVAQVKTLSRDCIINARDISLHEKHKIIKTFINNIPALVYIPGPTFNFSKIILGNVNFSHSFPKDEFKGLSSLLKDNELSIMHLSEVYKGESSDNYYDFADTNGKCSSADVKALESYKHSRFIFSLDISRRGTDECKFVSFHNNGVITHTHVVNAGYTANMVTDGVIVLWKGDAGEKCLYTLASFLDGIPILLNIFVRLSDGTLEHYYFYNNGEWTIASNLDYQAILEDLVDTTKSKLSKSVDRDTREVLTLDVAKVDTGKYTMETTKLRVLTSIKYSPPENSRVTKVVFGNDSLWQTLKAGVQCNFAVITYRGISIELAQLCIVDGCEKYMHFEMEDGRLSSITAEEYNDALSRLDSGDGESDEDFEFILSTIDTLDIITPAEVDFEIDRFQLDSLSSAVYLPLPKHTIGRVVLGKVLWTSDESKCLYVSTFSTEESIQLVQIVTENETLHFARLDKELAKVPQKKYNELFEKLGYRQVDQTPFYVPLEVPDAPNTISLDVSKALDSRVKAENGTFKGVSYTTFYTSEEGVIDRISSGKLTVWEPEEDEVCVYGRLYLDNGPKLLKIRTVGKDGSNIVHLAFDTDKWMYLSQDVFNDRLNLMVLKLTEPLKFALTTTTDGYYEYTFDLSRYHLDSRFNSGFMTYGGNKYAVCTPKNGVIKKVVQGSITIWTPSSDDYYASMVLLSRDTHLYILVQSPFNIPAVLSYHLKNNIWHMVNHEAISTDITKTLPIPSFRFTLDITGKHDPEKYRVFNMDINGVTTTVFITIYGYYFDKVVSGKDLIWQSSENEECRYLMVLDKSGKNSFITVFVDYMDGSKFMVYEMRDKWTFSHQLLGPENDCKTTTPAVFNLSDKTHQNIYFCDNVFNGIVHRAYSPLPGYHVQEVKDNETTIWQAEDKEQCIFILSVPGTDKSNTSLLSLFVRNEDYCGFKHFEKTDKWRHIDERGYDRRLIEKKQTNNVTTTVAIATIPQYKNAVTLDTANVDHDRVDLHEDSLNGTRRLYSAKTGDYFNSLSDNSKSVWKSDKDKCISVTIYGKDELHCRLDVLSSDVITPMYFCRKAGNWSSTNHNTFHEWLRSYVKTPRIKLDLGNLDTNFFESFRYTQNGYEILYGRPLPGYALTTVVDGSTEVWEAGHNQYATEFQMSIIGDYTLLSIINHSYQVENLCFLKSSNTWSPVDEDVYDQYLVPVNDSERVQDMQLDIAKPDFGIVTGHKDVMGDVTVLKYTPHLGRHVTAVVFGESTIWSGHYHDEYCISAEHITKGGAIFIRLFLKMGSSFEHRYFTKVEGRWVVLKEDEFKNKLGIQSVDVKIDAKSTPHDAESDPNVYTLNISGTVDRDKITATETTYEDVKSVTYSPKFIAGIGKVVDSDGTVWMGDSDQKCVTVVISSKEGHDSLVSLSINNDIVVQYKYLVKKDREWYLIRKIKYDELLTTMYRHSLVTHADTTFDNPITLDISTKPTEGVTFYEYTYNEVTYKTFKPKDDKSVVKVMDGEIHVWKSSSGKCIDAWTYSTPLSSLCRLDILSSGIITPHCFEKKGSVWISLGLKLYKEKLKKLVSYRSINVMIEASGVSRDICMAVEYFDKHAISTTIVPKLNIAKINYNKDMWESKDGTKCINAHFITSPGGDLAYINVKSSNGDISPSSFCYSSGKWHEGNHYNFSNVHTGLTPLSKEVFNGKLIDTTLDIRNVDNTFRIYNYSNSVVTHFEYQTPMNANVKRIVDGAQIIVWQGGENDRCLACEVYSREGYDPVLGFMIKNKYNVSISFFEKGGNEWNEINEETFNLRLASFSNNSRLQLLKDRLVDTFENADIFDRKTSCTSEDMNILYLNQWLLTHVPHWMMNHFKTLHQKKKSWLSRLF
ncbi:hypothetical protein BEWA_046960 [Theileria equi strain WA]|uniref:Signal peptide-containing protein n=1 Tax=Theileria equi strain WA TaxID=1537102 RepID=L1L9X2_THEEQ|nr:hypothetical protein BEWA_046960 [Theileria equi strain WA]EKX72232.1 hypothetical protein BEWA_046960 [Theileria equi strain WA]|eukprot:XP_004831684.1 hypothetical protein BEWA_046960 [Theileria equi strain WA]